MNIRPVLSLAILIGSPLAFADDAPDLSQVPPPPPPTINEQVQQGLQNNPQEPIIRAPLPSDRVAPPSSSAGENPAPPSDAPTREEMNPNTEPPPAVQEMMD